MNFSIKQIILFLCSICSFYSVQGQFTYKPIPIEYNHYSLSSRRSATALDALIQDKRLSVAERTTILQQYIDRNSEIVLPDQEIVIGKTGLNIGSNKTLIFQRNTVLKIEPNHLERYGVINIINSSNVKIYNARITGDRKGHTGKTGEWGMGINMLGARNILIDNFMIEDCWGDGIYVGRYEKVVSKNVSIKNGVVNNNRRNGISITSVSGLQMNRVTAANSNGTNPMQGIDFEANSPLDELNGIVLEDIVTFNNQKVGMMISFYRMAGPKNRFSKDVNITVRDFIDKYSRISGVLIAQIPNDFKSLTGKIQFDGVTVEGNTQPIMIRSNKNNNFMIELNNVNIVKPANPNFHNKELHRVMKDRSNVRIMFKN